jgi:hypothetical protein
LQETFPCTSVCALRLDIELLVYPIGPAGDTLHLPFRVVRGAFTGLRNKKLVVSGNDFTTLRAGKCVCHSGRLLVGDPAGDIVFTYEGTSEAPEGAYDGILEGRMPGNMRSTLVVCATSHNEQWRPHQRRPLIGLGNLDARRGLFEFTVLSLT